jgi:hypothetical protein
VFTLQRLSACVEAMRITACIEDAAVIENILAPLDAEAAAQTSRPAPSRPHPRAGSAETLTAVLASSPRFFSWCCTRLAISGGDRLRWRGGTEQIAATESRVDRGRRGGGRDSGDTGRSHGLALPLCPRLNLPRPADRTTRRVLYPACTRHAHRPARDALPHPRCK